MISKQERIEGGIWGLLVGDALGVPYEFNKPQNLKSLQIEMIPPENFKRSHNTVPPATWSDDGAQALCLLDSLLVSKKMDIEDFAKRILKWYEEGYMAVDEKVFDVGVQTAKSILAFRNGISAAQAGFQLPEGKGNGSLMRVLPLALWHQGSDEELVNDAHLQSIVTHGNIVNQVCCALYCLWVRGVMEELDIESAYRKSITTLRRIYSEKPLYLQELEWSIRPDEEIDGEGSGYVVDSIRSVRTVLKYSDYESVVKEAVLLGNDTDTTAAIAGGLAGVYFGVNGIPKRWMEMMRGKEVAEGLIEELVKIAVN